MACIRQSHGKYQIKACGVIDDLSEDMLAPNWPNLVFDLKHCLAKLTISFGI